MKFYVLEISGINFSQAQNLPSTDSDDLDFPWSYWTQMANLLMLHFSAPRKYDLFIVLTLSQGPVC